MDNAATTQVDPRVLKAMQPFFSKYYGNPSSLHSFGQEAKAALENARKKVANLISADPEEIIFTSGGTESDNLAIKGIAFAKNKGHIITTSIEHHAVLHACDWLKKQGFEVTILFVDKYGLINLKDLENAIRKDTILVSIMTANNEIGTIQPIKEIGEMCRKKRICFHTDAVQGLGRIPIDVKKMKIDLLSACSHKMHGPKGAGFLYKRKGVKIEPLIHGGGHEFGLRSGTENVSGIVGLGKACEIAKKEMKKEMQKLTKMRDKMIKSLLKVKDSRLNGHPTKRLPNNVNITFKFIEGEALVLQLDMHGIAASTGSACSTKSLKPSHVLTSIGLKIEEAHGSLRLTLGRYSTMNEVNYVIKTVPKVVNKLRKISPFKGKW